MIRIGNPPAGRRQPRPRRAIDALAEILLIGLLIAAIVTNLEIPT